MQRFILALALLAGCSKQPLQVHVFESDNYPEKLSAWGLLDASGDSLRIADTTLPYDLTTPLFSDYAQKFRSIHIPPGESATYQVDSVFDLPVGTIISKTFYYRQAATALLKDVEPQNLASLELENVQLLETRLLVHQADGWEAVPYIWKGEDAYLKLTGDLQTHILIDTHGESVELNYIVPTRNECAGCHVTNHSTGKLHPIGIKARHLNRTAPETEYNQLTHWKDQGLLTALPELSNVPKNASSTSDSIKHQALSYLDINCGHCHNPVGPADTSGLYLDYPNQSMRRLGVCKPPVAAGRGTGNRVLGISPGKPDESILLYRLVSGDPGVRMPEIGRTLQHIEGVQLINDWILALPGTCESDQNSTFNNLSS